MTDGENKIIHKIMKTSELEDSVKDGEGRGAGIMWHK